MFKKVFILFLFAAVVALAFLQMGYIRGSSEELSSFSKKALEQAASGDMDAACKTILKLDERWENEQHMYQALLEHSESDKISVSIKKSLEYAKCGDRTQFIAEAAALDFLLRHINEIDRLSFDNLL